MCGIVGSIGKSIKVDSLNNIQKHRGPDSQGVWNDDFVFFGHQRLSIIDLSERSNQPFQKDGLIIVFNGEIYNYQELKNDLELKGIVFATASDTEVVLEMFRLYKEKCIDFFIGMFAFAIYDISSKKTFLARDHFGIKPLFYSWIDNKLVFASELKTLIEIEGFDKTINQNALVSCVNYLWVSGNETMFQNCFKLPAAHYMKVDKDLNFEIKQYWELKENIFNQSEDEIKKGLQDVLEKSIQRHMVADVPVSAFLSGGLDSSLISVMAQKYNNNLSTYTIGTDAKDKKIEQMPEDEKYAKQLADLHSFDHHEIIINADIVKYLPFIVRTLDEPIGDPAAINTYLICEAARKEGVKVLLSGMGADEIFFGYRRQKATLLAQKYQKITPFIRNIIEKTVSFLPVEFAGKGLKIVRWAKRFLSFASLPLDESYMASYSYYSKQELLELLDAKFHDGINNLYKQHSKIFNEKFTSDTINQICNTDIQMFMQGLNLTYSDRASMAASVEVRVPFIDKEVIEYAMQIPGQYKYQNGQSKSILKKVAEKYLPHEIIYRPKASFGAPIRSWISNELKEMVDDLLSKKNIEKRGFFNYEMVKKIIDDDRNGKQDNAYRIYQMLTIELWCREFLD